MQSKGQLNSLSNEGGCYDPRGHECFYLSVFFYYPFCTCDWLQVCLVVGCPVELIGCFPGAMGLKAGSSPVPGLSSIDQDCQHACLLKLCLF